MKLNNVLQPSLNNPTKSKLISQSYHKFVDTTNQYALALFLNVFKLDLVQNLLSYTLLVMTMECSLLGEETVCDLAFLRSQ